MKKELKISKTEEEYPSIYKLQYYWNVKQKDWVEYPKFQDYLCNKIIKSEYDASKLEVKNPNCYECGFMLGTLKCDCESSKKKYGTTVSNLDYCYRFKQLEEIIEEGE
jgi:hypothetical protein